MARTKSSKPVKRVNPGHVSIRSDTGRMHKPMPQERWANYILTPWTDPNEYPSSRAARTAIQNANRAWRQTYPRNSEKNHVPALKVLAKRKIPGLSRYVFGADGSFYS